MLPDASVWLFVRQVSVVLVLGACILIIFMFGVIMFVWLVDQTSFYYDV